MTNDSRELFSHENLSSNDEYDLDAIPLHIVRTDSFQGMPGHEDLVDNFRGLASYDRTGETFVDYAGTSDYSLDYAPEVSIPRPQLSKQSNNVDMMKDNGVFQFDKVFPEKTKVVSSPSGVPEPKPFLLMRTNWTVTGMTVSCIESKINSCLKNMPDASVNAVPGKCKVSFDFRLLVLCSVVKCFYSFLVFSEDYFKPVYHRFCVPMHVPQNNVVWSVILLFVDACDLFSFPFKINSNFFPCFTVGFVGDAVPRNWFL